MFEVDSVAVASPQWALTMCVNNTPLHNNLADAQKRRLIFRINLDHVVVLGEIQELQQLTGPQLPCDPLHARVVGVGVLGGGWGDVF